MHVYVRIHVYNVRVAGIACIRTFCGGEFSGPSLQMIFCKLNDESENKLAKTRTKQALKRWMSDDTRNHHTWLMRAIRIM